MSDVLSKEQRHRCMYSIRNKDTKPEYIVRKYLFAQGFRYRINVKSLLGKPDIVLRKYHTVILINGCFWHGHENCKYGHLPKSNTEFWKTKIRGNIERDKRDILELKKQGWNVIVIWQCEIRNIELQSERLAKLPSEIKSIQFNSIQFNSISL
jgi:DNA mismatch endonuclease (patch repair protein)